MGYSWIAKQQNISHQKNIINLPTFTNYCFNQFYDSLPKYKPFFSHRASSLLSIALRASNHILFKMTARKHAEYIIVSISNLMTSIRTHYNQWIWFHSCRSCRWPLTSLTSRWLAIYRINFIHGRFPLRSQVFSLYNKLKRYGNTVCEAKVVVSDDLVRTGELASSWKTLKSKGKHNIDRHSWSTLTTLLFLLFL